MIPFVRNIQNTQIHRYRKDISCCQELGQRGKYGMTAHEYGVSLGDDDPLLELHDGDISHLCEYTKNH